jgi:hypothetical protein
MKRRDLEKSCVLWVGALNEYAAKIILKEAEGD